MGGMREGLQGAFWVAKDGIVKSLSVFPLYLSVSRSLLLTREGDHLSHSYLSQAISVQTNMRMLNYVLPASLL